MKLSSEEIEEALYTIIENQAYLIEKCKPTMHLRVVKPHRLDPLWWAGLLASALVGVGIGGLFFLPMVTPSETVSQQQRQ